MTHPVAVIGAGMGGLAAALSLASVDVPVVLLEKHPTPGGKMRQVTVAGRPLDAGPTVFTMRWVFERLFRNAGMNFEDHVNLQPAELLARHSWLNSDTLDLFCDVDASSQAISEFAGGRDADNYLKFALETEQVFQALDTRFMRTQRPDPVSLSMGHGLRGAIELINTQPFRTLWSSLAKRFDDPRLQQLFARYATYCGSSPFKAPATLMLIAHVERSGVWLLGGGMHALAKALSDAAVAKGVDCRYGVGVNAIETERGQVSRLQLDDGSSLPVKAAIFNGDTQALTQSLLGPNVKKAVSARSEASLSAVTVCQVARTSGFDLAHHSVFFGNDYPDEFDSIFNRQGFTAYPTVYVCAQDRSGDVSASLPSSEAVQQPSSNGHSRNQPHGLPPNPATEHPHERLLSLINAPARPLADQERGDAVERLKQTLESQGLCVFDDLAEPVITDPGRFNDLFPATDGALYGRPTHGWMGSFNRPGARSNVKGLYLCGGSVHPGAGIPMATLSGQLAAEQYLLDTGKIRSPLAQ